MRSERLFTRFTVYASAFKERVESTGIEKIIAAPRSPWQNAFVERVIGSIRRECVDYVVVFNEQHLHRRLLSDYFEHYHRWRCHRCPVPRLPQGPELGQVVEVAEAGRLYRHVPRKTSHLTSRRPATGVRRERLSPWGTALPALALHSPERPETRDDMLGTDKKSPCPKWLEPRVARVRPRLALAPHLEGIGNVRSNHEFTVAHRGRHVTQGT